jgi:hypothetical protein
MSMQMELTDTFGGEANYCWVRRAPLPPCKQTQRGIVRAAKTWAGWTGLHCTVESYGGTEYRITPRGLCQVLFITWEDTP